MKGEKINWTLVLAAIAVSFTIVAGIDFLRHGPQRFPVAPEWSIQDADPARGREAIERYGCGACHVVPGVRNARGRVGPQLKDFANQVFIAGRVANTPENLILWLRDPQAIDPETVMPNVGVTEQDARDIAAYLYTLSAN